MDSKFCSCPYRKIVMDMQSTIKFDELTGHEDDYKNIFKELVRKHFEEDKHEANKTTESKTA